MRRGALFVACLLLAAIGAGCLPGAPKAAPTQPAVARPASPGPAYGKAPTGSLSLTATPVASVPPGPTLAATIKATAAPATASPAPHSAVTPTAGLAPFVDPDGLWSVQYPAQLLHGELLPSGVVVLVSQDRNTFAAVDTYLAKAGDYGNAGEGLRKRAREALAGVYGRPISETGAVDRTDMRGDLWEVGISYRTDSGAQGQALYAMPGREQGDYRVYGFLTGYRAGNETSQRPLVELVRDSFRPVTLLPLQVPAGSTPRWALFSYGLRTFNPQLAAEHFVAIYSRDNGWREVDRLWLEAPDYVHPQSLRQAQLEPSHIWLEVAGGMGVHGSSFDLLSLDGKTLKSELQHAHPAPGAGSLRDLNGDGILEVLLNTGDPYVFCYACGVRLEQSEVWRWDGTRLVEVQLTPLPVSAPADLRSLANRAVALAKGGLYKDAQATIEKALALKVQDPVLSWDAALIRLQAEARAAQARESPYPLLSNLFYGDYAYVLGIMRSHSPAAIFDIGGPLIAGTAAAGWEKELSAWVTRTATLAIGAEPNLAAAYFLRGWGAYIGDPQSKQAPADVQQAAQLDPNEPLYAQCAAYLKGR